MPEINKQDDGDASHQANLEMLQSVASGNPNALGERIQGLSRGDARDVLAIGLLGIELAQLKMRQAEKNNVTPTTPDK